MPVNEKIIILIILFLPSYLIRVNIFGLPTNILDLLIMAAISLWLFKNKNKKQLCLYLFAWKPLAMLLVGLILGTVLSGNYAVGAGIIKSWFILPFIFALIAKGIFRNKEDLLLKSLFYSTVWVASAGMIYYLMGEITYDGRTQAFFNSPNYLAMYLAPGIIGGLYLFQNKPKIYGTGLIILTACFYLTFSYAAWIALLMSVFCLYLLKIKSGKEASKYSILMLMVCIIGMFFIKQSGSAKMNDLLTYSRSSVDSRLMIWKASTMIIADNIFIGIGPGNFQEKYLDYQKYFPPYLEWAVPHPHNLFLSFWVFSGLTGLVGFFWLMTGWIRLIMFRTSEKMTAPAIAIMAYFLINGLVDTTYFKNDLAVVFWLVYFLPIGYKSIR